MIVYSDEISGIIDNYSEENFVVRYALVAKKPFVTGEYNIKKVCFKTSGQPINGFMGAIKYTDAIARYLPYINLGSQIHIGKKTTRACEEYLFII